MIVVPLVFASVIRGLASSEDIQQLRKLGLRLVLYFVATTAVAITIGVAVALGDFINSSLVQSAAFSEVNTTGQEIVEPLQMDNIPEMISGILPDNPLGSMVNSEMLQVVVFAVIFGLALVAMPPDQAKPLLDLLSSIQQLCMTVVRWAMILAPFSRCRFYRCSRYTGSRHCNLIHGIEQCGYPARWDCTYYRCRPDIGYEPYSY